MLRLLPVVARSHPLCWKLDPLCAICNVLSIGLQSCLTILIVAVRENAWPAARQTRNTFFVCSKVSNWSGSQASTTYIKPAREGRTAEVAGPDLSLHFITNHKDGLLLRDLIVRAAAFNGCGKLPMDRWLSDSSNTS
jgi:hypothetical protein